MRRLLLLLALVTVPALPGAAGAQPAPVPEAALVGIRSIATAETHTCALLTTTEVRCWGEGSYGMLGNDHPTNQQSYVPVAVVDEAGTGHLTGVTQLSLGYAHSCALLTSGQVRCWGFNNAGQLGTNTGYSSFKRPQVVLNGAGTGPLQNVIAIDAGDETTCALMANHTIRCWGSNGTGTVGDGTGADQELPRAVRNLAGTGSLTGVTQISIGGDHGCARLANGQLRCWGYNSSGQVGDGTRVNRWRPKAVRAVSGAGNLTGVAQVSAGEALTCARLANSQVRCWGRGADGGLGTGNPRRSSTPKVVKAAGGGNLTGVAQVDAGYSAACGRLANGRLRCWGLNDRGQSGDGTSVAHHYLPVVVKAPSGAAPLSGATQLAFTDRHGCVRLGSGEARCWGYGASGDLGDGNANDSPLPVVVNA